MKKSNLEFYIITLIKKYKYYIIALILLAISAAILNLIVNYQIKKIIDSIALNPKQNILWILLSFSFYKIIYHGCYFLRRILDLKYKPLILKEITLHAYNNTCMHSLFWFESYLSGDISSKISDWQDSIITLTTVIYGALVNVIIIIVGIFFLLSIHNLTALVIFVFVIIYVPILSLMLKKQLKLQGEYVKSRQSALGIINDSIANIFTVKIIGNVKDEIKSKLDPAIENWCNWDRKTREYDTYKIDLTDTILVSIMGGVQICLLASLYINGKITAGDFAFVSAVTLNIHSQLDELLEYLLFSINPKIAAIKSSYSFFSDMTDKDILSFNSNKKISRLNGDISFKSVRFNYGKNIIFDDLNITIKSGQKIGIVGASGAGKTTFIKSLLRYFDINDGNIIIGEYNIKNISEEDLRANISIIPQDIVMFHRTIYENIIIAKPDASFEEVKQACIKASINDVIENMPDKYDTTVGERGIKLSGGQRQRVAIARAILKNAPILILDEATSALDSSTEISIQKSILELLNLSKSTSIVIAHRLSTLINMDRILVFDQGKIIQDGSHNDLITQEGMYKTMWKMQNEGFLIE